MKTSTAPITGVHVVGIPVSDQERALAFYRDVLGLEVRMDAPFGDGRWLEVGVPGAATGLALERADAAGVNTGIRLATSDAAAVHRTLLDAGARVDAELLDFGPGVPPMFSLRDPDGNELRVVELP